MIAKLSYVMCDVCGDPAPCADTAEEATNLALGEGYRYEPEGVHTYGARIRCRKCQELDR